MDFAPESQLSLSLFISLTSHGPKVVGWGSDVERKKVTTLKIKALFISRTVKSEFFHCPEIISVFFKKLLEVQKAHLYKNYYTFSLLPAKRSEGLDPINGKNLLQSTT